MRGFSREFGDLRDPATSPRAGQKSVVQPSASEPRGASKETSNPARASERGIRAVPSQRDAVDTRRTFRFMRYSSVPFLAPAEGRSLPMTIMGAAQVQRRCRRRT